MKKSTILVAGIWFLVVGSGLVQGFTLPTSKFALETSRMFPGLSFSWQIEILMPLVVVAMAFFDRRRVLGELLIGKIIDRKFGPDSYRGLIKSLKPELLFFSMSFAIGVIGFARTIQVGGPSGALLISGFFTGAGVAFLAIHYIQRR